MRKFKKTFLTPFTILIILSLVLYFSLSQVFAQKIKVYKGSHDFAWIKPKIDSTKKTILIIADNDGTEMFDLMAPFYLFNATRKANVFVVSQKKAPILLVNSLFILPHYTFSEIDSLYIIPDVIVIPNLSIDLKIPPNPITVNWIKSHFKQSTIILSICDGSATAAATGIYDGKPLTTHASDFKALQRQFHKPNWVQDLSVTESGNLYSTAGVSNAVEGSLTVIKRIFGEQTMQYALNEIGYPHPHIKIDHKSKVVNNSAIFKIGFKMLFKRNLNIGVWLTDHIDEFQLASVLDTYVRSFPQAINSYSFHDKKIISKYGLTIYPSGFEKKDRVQELHVFHPVNKELPAFNGFTNVNIINYPPIDKRYAIDVCLQRIETLYGTNFMNVVKLMLDYN